MEGFGLRASCLKRGGPQLEPFNEYNMVDQFGERFERSNENGGRF